MDVGRSPVAGVVLAAGLGRRYGGSKLSAAFGGKPLLCWAVQAALDSALHPVVVVLGHDSARLRSMLSGETGCGRLRLIVNDAYAEGQASSVVAGLREVPGEADAAMFLMGDQPLLPAPVIDALVTAHRRSGKSICYPVCNGRRRTPVIFGRRHFPDILGLSGDTGARAVIEAHPQDAATVAFDDESVFGDVDCIDDLRLLERHGRGAHEACDSL